MTINAVLEALCDEMAADGVPGPLYQQLTLATLWHDLARLAGEEPPAAVVALLDDGPPDNPHHWTFDTAEDAEDASELYAAGLIRTRHDYERWKLEGTA